MRCYKKRLTVLALALLMVFSAGCSGGVISETKKLEPAAALQQEENKQDKSGPEKQAEKEGRGEFPPADEPLPVGDKEAEGEAQAEAEAAAKAQAEAEAAAKAQAEAEAAAKAQAEAEAAAKAQAEAEAAAKAQAEAEAAAKAQAEAEAAAKAQAEAEAAAKAQAEAEARAKAEAEAAAKAQAEAEEKANRRPAAALPNEVRAIWISYLDFDALLKNQSKSGFTRNMREAFSDIAGMGLNTVYVQVRPFGDALYDSDIFPYSYIMTGTEGQGLGFDPLEIMVGLAHDEGLRIEAWINPYRVRAAGSSRSLSASNPALRALNTGMALQYDGGIFYNPASSEARDLITDGVIEIVENYDVDGIHFDDYFYPTTDMSFDAAFYDSYRASGGGLTQADWRRDNVNKLVRQVYNAVKRSNSGVAFGISPQANDQINYNGQFANTESWLINGWVDYICPQIYFGFENSTAPYGSSLDYWHKLARSYNVDLYVGLAVYKCGVADNWAGGGKNEWINNSDLISRMVEAARDKSSYAGFALYRYDSVFNPASPVSRHISRELAALEDIL